ncbi:SDR family NAD(P)-dependent oxidoreductase [Kutzneria viridogrisea]|uniref:NAD(P)-dependent dehydrogenase (Short-subunit alcohol dehydrogenase family) n=1 Tax=Kutzneria viridogrisea TaxID=47990 RepID=A0ABR6BW65_9PSEU|nr:NAD(P)-dependent dehydrogenase (short-subunit alcohol dehydrogenase family) [Kutzneria viridogrisea]
MRRFEDEVAVVTGGAHGIGLAIVRRLAEEGAVVAVADLDGAAAESVAAQVGGLAITCDVGDRSSVGAAFATVLHRYGRLDVLVNNVGVCVLTPFEQTDDEVWQRSVDPTLTGAVRCIQAALPHLLANPAGGSVVSIGSVNGLMAFGDPAYSAAKAGLQSLTQNMAGRYGPQALRARGQGGPGVRFNLVAPGTVRTRSWTSDENKASALDRVARHYPMGRVGEPEDIAAAVAFLASSDAAWITGAVLPVDGGITAVHSGFVLDVDRW